MRLGQGCHKRTPRWCWVTMLVFASCVLPGAALVVTGDETERETAGDLKLVAVPKAWPAVPAPLGYGSAGGAPPDRDRGELTMAAYALGGAADKLQQELACEPADALQLVINLVIREARLTDQPLPVRDRIWVSDDQLIVAALAAEHTRIAAALSRLQALGTTQISIRVRFVAVPAAVLNRSVDDWQLAALDLEEESGSWHDVAAESPLDRPLPSGSARPLAKADLTTTVNLPPIYKIVNSQQANELLRQWQQDQRTSLLAAPTITVFNGQTASIGASSQRPFVVGLKQIDPLRKKFEPQVRVVESGRIVRLRPLLRTAKKLWLNYDVRVSEIQAVSKTTVRAAGLTEPVTLQVPQVSTARIESAIEFEFGQTVIIGGLPEPTRGGKSHQLVLLMSATRVGLPNIDHIELELPADKLDLPKLRSHLAEPSAQVAADSIEDLRRKLNQKIPVSFSGVPLRAAVDTISVLAGVKVTFAEKEIAAEGVAMNQAVTIRLTNEISVKSALRLILEPLNLSYSLRGDAIFVRVKSRDQLYTVVYNVADILMSEQRVKPRKLSDVAAADFAALVDQITQNVAPDTWGNGAGAIEPFVTNLSLVVSQTPEVHQEVAAFLEKRRVLPQTATVGATEGAAPAADDPGRSESPARPGR